MTATLETGTDSTARICTDGAAWNRLVERADGPPFARWEWGTSCETYGHDRLYLAVDDGTRLVAGLPLFLVRSRLFGSKLVSPPFGEHGPLLSVSGAAKDARFEILQRVLELADERDVDFVSVRGWGADTTEPFETRTRFVTFQNAVGDGPEAVWDQIKSSRKRQIRQAEENTALTYDVGDSLDDLRDFYGLYLESMRDHGTPPHAWRFFRTLWDSFHGADAAHLGLIRRHGDPINAVLDLSQGSSVHQWAVCTDAEHRELNGGSLVTWKSLEWAAERGYDTYDFGRTREGSGVYMFKKSFGGEKTWYDDTHYFPGGETALPHPEDETYDELKWVWKHLPLPITRYVGPSIRKCISL